MYVQRNTDTRCSVEEINYYTCCVCARACVRACVCVCVPLVMRRIVFQSVARLTTIFFHIIS